MTINTATASSTAAMRTRGRHKRAAGTPRRTRELAYYADAAGRRREVVACAGAAGSVLVIDRDASTRAELRLVAQLAPDEPAENANVVCALYLGDSTRGRCRRIPFEGLDGVASFAEVQLVDAPVSGPPTDSDGRRYRIEPLASGRSTHELRWIGEGAGLLRDSVLTLRDVIGRVESYEPARALTLQMLARHRGDSNVSVCTLRGELARVDCSRIVLNRGLREAVVAAVESGALSASEIAIRCDRMRRDARGNLTGETSWLARRVGLIPEAGAHAPTPWIHSDVLALVARRGLGISPHEVELG